VSLICTSKYRPGMKNNIELDEVEVEVERDLILIMLTRLEAALEAAYANSNGSRLVAQSASRRARYRPLRIPAPF
jgi:hypothetical protein